MRKRERGFTLIEMMIVVALIAVLAAVVVPTFFRETRKAKIGSEVQPMLAEIATKLEQYKSDNNAYVNASNLTNADPPICPSTTSTPGVNAISTCVTTGSAWETLRIQPTQTLIHCTYEIVVGAAGDAYTGAPLPAGITFDPPDTTGWYTILATCDSDGAGTPNAQYLRSSIDSTVQVVNEGR